MQEDAERSAAESGAEGAIGDVDIGADDDVISADDDVESDAEVAALRLELQVRPLPTRSND